MCFVSFVSCLLFLFESYLLKWWRNKNCRRYLTDPIIEVTVLELITRLKKYIVLYQDEKLHYPGPNNFPSQNPSQMAVSC